VLVAGALGKHRAEDFEVGGHRRVVVTREPAGQALFEIPGGRMKRMIKMTRIGVEQVAMRHPQPFADVDNVEPGPRRQFERDLDWGNCHGYGLLV